MSIPKKHHYVSEVLTKNFIDTNGKVPYYDKTKDYFALANSPKSIFWEENLNSTITPTGEIDHISVEATLNREFEQDFPKHYNLLVDALESNDYTSLIESNEYLMRMGIIGNMRTREYQIETENSIFGGLLEVTRYAVDELRESFDAYLQELSKVKNKFGTDFKQLLDGIVKIMDEIIYTIFLAPEDEYFILPDCTSSIHRSCLDDDIIHNGKVFKSFANQIDTVIFPVSSKILLVCQAKKVCPREHHGIYELRPEIMFKYNRLLFKSAHKRVACPDKDYLNNLVNRIKQSNSVTTF